MRPCPSEACESFYSEIEQEYGLSNQFNQDVSFDFDTFEETTETDLNRLKAEVKHLRTEVKQLKKMMVLNVFKSREEFEDFFSDIW